jgi:hypothetical protein
MRSRPILQAGAIVAVLLVGISAAALVTRDHRGDARDDERRRLELVTSVLDATVIGDVDEVRDVAGLFAAPRRVEAPAFAVAAGGVLDRRPTLDAIIFASADPADRTPITYAATRPDSAIPGPPGTDLGADEGRMEAIRLARDSGATRASRPISVLGGTGRAVAVVSPVYRAGPAPVTVAGRRAAIRGFAVAILRLDHLETALAAALPSGLGYSVADAPSASPLVSVDPGPRAATDSVPVAGRRWEVSVARADRGVPALAWGLGAGALVLAVLLAGLLRGGRPGPVAAPGRHWRAAMVRLRRGV